MNNNPPLIYLTQNFFSPPPCCATLSPEPFSHSSSHTLILAAFEWSLAFAHYYCFYLIFHVSNHPQSSFTPFTRCLDFSSSHHNWNFEEEKHLNRWDESRRLSEWNLIIFIVRLWKAASSSHSSISFHCF